MLKKVVKRFAEGPFSRKSLRKLHQIDNTKSLLENSIKLKMVDLASRKSSLQTFINDLRFSKIQAVLTQSMGIPSTQAKQIVDQACSLVQQMLQISPGRDFYHGSVQRLGVPLAAVMPSEIDVIQNVLSAAVPGLIGGSSIAVLPSQRNYSLTYRVCKLLNTAFKLEVAGHVHPQSKQFFENPSLGFIYCFRQKNEARQIYETISTASGCYTQSFFLLRSNNTVFFRDQPLDQQLWKITRTAFIGAGQSVHSFKRAVVRKGSTLFQRLCTQTDQYIAGDPSNQGSLTCLFNQQLIEQIQSVKAQLKAQGAQIHGGQVIRLGEALFLKPCVVLLKKPNSIWLQGIRGPLLLVREYQSDEQALQLINNNNYGWTASLYGRETQLLMKMGERIEASGLHINCVSRGEYRMSLQGLKRSGKNSIYGSSGFKNTVYSRSVL